MARKRRTKRKRTSRAKVKKMYRSGKNKVVGGVCGGIGEYLDVDPTIIRLFWILAFFVGGVGFLAYILAWLVIPKNPRHRW
jgi:phage shock protein C